ncbi:MAG: hypothetical protein PHV12_01125 [Bacteroidales bacterium]|jgi:hypothetical protein|nr:hypothetical protein [Bacteroidales bacterium]MDD3272715.1 hypothetical protein [Bacteroidales bacterium]MDD4058091.1 hypothetical protein [Bacteroidales bacterium]
MRKIAFSIFILFCPILSSAQNKLHMVGVSYGYNISNVNFDPPIAHSSVNTIKNFSILYNYYHDIWGSSPYFGLQTGISRFETGYKIQDEKFITELYRVPLISQFHIDFWKMRLLVNLGAYGAYRSKRIEPESSYFDPEDNRMEFGIIGGGGLAFIFRPFELHLEANYNYSLTYLNDPRKGGSERPQYSYPNHLILSASLFFHIKSK